MKDSAFIFFVGTTLTPPLLVSLFFCSDLPKPPPAFFSLSAKGLRLFCPFRGDTQTRGRGQWYLEIEKSFSYNPYGIRVGYRMTRVRGVRHVPPQKR